MNIHYASSGWTNWSHWACVWMMNDCMSNDWSYEVSAAPEYLGLYCVSVYISQLRVCFTLCIFMLERQFPCLHKAFCHTDTRAHIHTPKQAYTRTSGWLFSGFKMEFFNLTFYPRWESTPYSSYIPLGNRNHRLCLYNCVWVWAQWCLKLSAAKCAW